MTQSEKSQTWGRMARSDNQAGQPTLGGVMRALRAHNGWTLKEMSDRSGIPVSTLSKVEHDRLTLTYDKLQQLSQRLGIRTSADESLMSSLMNLHGPEAGADGADAPVIRDLRKTSAAVPKRRAAAGGL